MNVLNNTKDYLLGNVYKDKANKLAAESAEVTIEDNWKGDIKAGAFAGLENPVSINTNDITGVEDRAFKDCKRLKTLIMPNIERVGENVFEGCSNLCKLDAADGHMAKTIIKKITDCGLKQRIDIYIRGEFRISIKNDCNYIFNDKVPELMVGSWFSMPLYLSFTGMKKNIISAGAFKNMNNLRGLDISEATEIEGNAFENCTNLDSVTVKDENMAEAVIKYLIESGLKQEIDIDIYGEGYKISIKNNQACLSNLSRYGRFDKIVKDNNFTLPHYDFTGDLEYVLPSNSLSNVNNLQRLDTNAIAIIEDEAFEGCKNLEEIYLPSVKEIGKEVFKGCEKLCNVHVSDDMVKKIKDVLIESGLSQQVYIHVNGTVVACLHDELSKDMIKEAMERNEGWISDDNIEIPGYYIKIDDNAFTLSSITKINTNKVTSIGKFVCSHCDNLKEIYIPKVEEIGLGLCFGCPNLEKVTVKDEPMTNKIKESLISYNENRSSDVSVYVEGQSDPFFKIKKDDPLINIENSILIISKVATEYLNKDVKCVEEILSVLRKYDQDMRMSYIIYWISEIAGKSLSESEIESMIDKVMSEIDN